MKKILLALAAVLCAATAFSQIDFQESYDFWRAHPVSTIEVLNNDPWGTTYFFTNISHPIDGNTPAGYYTELERELCFWRGTKLESLSLHVEWNGGQMAANTWLGGAQYLLHSADYSNILALGLYYRHTCDDRTIDVPLQFSVVGRFRNIARVEGLCGMVILDVYGNNAHWVTDKGLEETTVTVFNKNRVWYNVGRHFGCPNLNVMGVLEIGYNHEGGWHSGIDFMKNKGLNATASLGVLWEFL